MSGGFFFFSQASEEEIRREKDKAGLLRKSRWWLNKRASGVCYYCGRSVPARELTMDHVVPLVRGGKSEKNNIVPACRECNYKKKYLLPMEWEEYIEARKKEG